MNIPTLFRKLRPGQLMGSIWRQRIPRVNGLNLTSLAFTTMTQKSPQILVAVVGVGLVGSEFINQLLSIPVDSSPFRLISLTSSSRTVFFEPSGAITSVAKWKTTLSESNEKPDYATLTKKLSDLISSSTKVAIIDNTSSEVIAALYPVWLKAGINVITPNKKAYSGDLALYENILSASKESGARFLNESTVGAGLPVISTLKELVATGDKVDLLCQSISLLTMRTGQKDRRCLLWYNELHL